MSGFIDGVIDDEKKDVECVEFFMPKEELENQVDNLMTQIDDSKVSAFSKILFARSGIFFENDNAKCLRMLDPEFGKFTHDLIVISKEFGLISQEFRSNVGEFLETMERIKRAIDMNKQRLVRKRSSILKIKNLLVEQKGDIKHEIDEKKKELQRLQIYIRALKKVKQEKEEIVSRLVKK